MFAHAARRNWFRPAMSDTSGKHLSYGKALTGAIALAVRGLNPSAVVSALLAGVFLTPAAYYLAVRLSIRLRDLVRRRPLAGLLGGAIGVAAVFEIVRWLTWLADPASHGRFW